MTIVKQEQATKAIRRFSLAIVALRRMRVGSVPSRQGVVANGRLASVFVLCMCALALTGQAHEVAVAWDPGTPVGLVSGYRLHRGNESGIYTESLDVGPATTATISGLIAGETYYFAVTAYGPSGDESRYSAEAVWTAPEYIWLEAEQAELSGGFAEEQTVSASAGTYIRAPLDEASQAVFDFEARGGQYYVWALVAADGADHDSDNYLGTIDSGLEDVWTLDRETQPCHSNGWSWAGIHGSSDPALQVGSTRFSSCPGGRPSHAAAAQRPWCDDRCPAHHHRSRIRSGRLRG